MQSEGARRRTCQQYLEAGSGPRLGKKPFSAINVGTIRGDWQLAKKESPYKKELEFFVRDLRFDGFLVRQSICGKQHWVTCLKNEKTQRLGKCGDNLTSAFVLLAEQHQDGDSPVRVLADGFQERSRHKIVEEVQKFLHMDTHKAIRIGDLKIAGIVSGRKAQVSRVCYATFIDTTNVCDNR